MIATQIGIALCGVTAVYLSQDLRVERRKWASVFGLIGQPAWVIEAVSAEQWGILFLSVVYTWAWWRGFRAHWLSGRAGP